MKKYTIERWCGETWGWRVVSTANPTTYQNRSAAEKQLNFESAGGGRYRLLNAKGHVVLHRGTVKAN